MMRGSRVKHFPVFRRCMCFLSRCVDSVGPVLCLFLCACSVCLVSVPCLCALWCVKFMCLFWWLECFHTDRVVSVLFLTECVMWSIRSGRRCFEGMLANLLVVFALRGICLKRALSEVISAITLRSSFSGVFPLSQHPLHLPRSALSLFLSLSLYLQLSLPLFLRFSLELYLAWPPFVLHVSCLFLAKPLSLALLFF